MTTFTFSRLVLFSAAKVNSTGGKIFCVFLSISINSDEVNFIITDFKNEINVTYSGVVPNLFAEEKGVVAEGFLKDRNFFSATKILAKHDENYMPPEVKEALGEK